jgi:hypothetical protein
MLLQLLLIFLFAFYSIGVFSDVDSKPPQKEQNIESILLNGGFSGVFDKNTEMFFIGQYKNKTINRKAYYYEREFGSARRMTKRVVIVSGDVYSGMYSVPDGPPVLKDGVLIFPNHDDGCCISLKGEELPKKVLIDGEMLELFK